MADYSPNLNDPRVANRCHTALGFVLGVMSEHDPKSWSTRYIDKHLGQQQLPLSKWLRKQLLITTDEHYNKNTGKCKSYILNTEGVNELKHALISARPLPQHALPSKLNLNIHSTDPLMDHVLVGHLIEREYGDQLRSGDFQYRESHHRLWNGLQNIRRCHRVPIMAGYDYSHQYDISTSCATVLEQLSRRYGNDLWMPHLENYQDNKHEVRNTIQQEFEISEKTAKVLINSLFCGARIGLNPDFATTHMLDGDVSKIMLAKEHPVICGLREEIRTCWNHIITSGSEISRRRKLDTGRLIPVSSRDKWIVYFKYERYIINSMRKFVNKQMIRCFLEHDGIRTTDSVDIQELTHQIYLDTGFDVKLDYQYTETSGEFDI